MYKHATQFLNSPNKPDLNRVPGKAEFEWAILDRVVKMIACQRFVDEVRRRWMAARNQLQRNGKLPTAFDEACRRIEGIGALEQIVPVSRRDVRRLSKSRLDRILAGTAADHLRYMQTATKVRELSDFQYEQFGAIFAIPGAGRSCGSDLRIDELFDQFEDAARAELRD